MFPTQLVCFIPDMSICTWYKMTGLKKSFVPGDLDRMIDWADDNILNGEKFEAIKSGCLQERKTRTSYICNEQTITIKHHGKDLGVYMSDDTNFMLHYSKMKAATDILVGYSVPSEPENRIAC